MNTNGKRTYAHIHLSQRAFLNTSQIRLWCMFIERNRHGCTCLIEPEVVTLPPSGDPTLVSSYVYRVGLQDNKYRHMFIASNAPVMTRYPTGYPKSPDARFQLLTL
jgi:hypothetical protein